VETTTTAHAAGNSFLDFVSGKTGCFHIPGCDFIAGFQVKHPKGFETHIVKAAVWPFDQHVAEDLFKFEIEDIPGPKQVKCGDVRL
jgi:hypothetical protein